MFAESRPRTAAFAIWRALQMLLAWICVGGAVLSHGQSAALLLPSGVAYDSAGDLYFTDASRNQVFEVSLAGVLSVVAGNGVQGFAGDGGPSQSAQLNAPQGLAVGADGTVYFADTGNQRIRAVSGGLIQTVVGSGVRGFSGDGGPALAAAMNKPGAVAMDASGALLICDTGNQRVRRVSLGTITTLAGTGVQGFAGDGSPAINAELDSPMGVVAMPDGRTVVADSHNHRLRVIETDGTMQTFAGTGTSGFSGDGGAAIDARLFRPRGVGVTASGSVVFADSDNHRIRMVNAQGMISTIAGDGWQGSAADASVAGAASLNTPRGVTASPYGVASFADSPNRFVREIAADGKVYIVAAPQARVSVVTLTTPATLTYGQSSADIGVTGNAATPQGQVTIAESGTILGSAMLSSGVASLPLHTMAAGAHTLIASYGGDGLNPTAAAAPTTISVQPASVVATANAATMIYGQAVPQLTGAETGILPQDASTTAVSFSTIAGTLAPVGTYPITATLTGGGSQNYRLTLAASSGSLTVTQAQSSTALQTQAQAYAGLPLVLSASLRPVTSGVPTGAVNFLDSGVVVATATAVNGVASSSYLAPAAGSHTLQAAYGGDGNFVRSMSAPLTIVVTALPDFSVVANNATQTVQAGLIASYPLTLTPVGSPFTGSVSFSITGLPTGALASFSPQSVVPGASGAATTLSVQTPASVVENRRIYGGLALAASCLPVLLSLRRRKRIHLCRALLAGGLCAALTAVVGCGARTVSTSTQESRSFPLTVTATSTNLAGVLVTHTVTLTLNVQ